MLREVNALSRMSHSSIVRYYTVRQRLSSLGSRPKLIEPPLQTWVEPVQNEEDDDSAANSDTSDQSQLSTEFSLGDGDSDPYHVSESSLPEISFARSSTFPSLQGSSTPASGNGDDSSLASSGTQRRPRDAAGNPLAHSPKTEILYIQMVGTFSA